MCGVEKNPMVSVYVLLCAAALSRGECTEATAIDVIRMPDAENALTCLRGSMMTLGPLAIQPKGGEYWKIICLADDDNFANLPATGEPGLSTALRSPRLDP
jgi:hypothetical protein